MATKVLSASVTQEQLEVTTDSPLASLRHMGKEFGGTTWIRIQYSPNVCLVQSPLSPVGCNTHVFCVLQLCASVVTKIIFLSLFMNLSGFGEKINRMDVNRQLIGNCSDS